MAQVSRHQYREVSLTAALRLLGPVVYALRLDDGVIKIGYTTNLEDRRHTVCKQSGSQSAEVLGFRIGGTYAEEQAIHDSLRAHVAKRVEYYHPTAEVMAVVNDLRSTLDLPHVL
jgi:hypothetical protein